MSKNKFFKFFCFIFLFFFFNVHSVFADRFSDATDANLEYAGEYQASDQKQITASTWDLDDGKFYYGQNETVLKGRIAYEQEHAFQVTS